MLDPVTAGFISNLAADLGGRAILAWSKAIVAGSGVPNADQTLDGFYALPADDGEVEGILSASQLQEVEKFLESSEVAAVVQALFLARFLPAKQGERTVIGLEAAFQALASDYCIRNGHVWSSLTKAIWHQLTAFYGSVMPNSEVVARIPSSDLSRLHSYMREPAELGGNTEPLPPFVRYLLDVSESPKRLSEVRTAVNDLRRAYGGFFASMRLNHAQDNYKYTFDELYISRTLLDRTTSESFPSSEALSLPSMRPRMVVVGDPGVGKSTLVEHLIYSLTRAEYAAEYATPAMLRCRDYAGMGRSTPLLHALTAQMSSDMHHDLDVDLLRDMLALGRIFLIFDGVDEIVDLAYRRQVVDRIESLAIRYPLAPILVTSRRIGYNTAPFNPELFDVLDLVEFTEAQVAEYVDRWFRKSSRSEHDREGFLRESVSLHDIRTNPLMLSLLCILYRARGYIPRNRREIYRECADLLFHRWDSMRKIEQPLDHRRYGHHLMQDLADFFSRHEEAQAGIEEKQVKGLIATFFTDTAGVDRLEATSRAAEFLDFCSNRAWLLTVKGVSERGERLFGFTHRTFMEFYTAEAVVRNAGSLGEIAIATVSAYARDASSVLADLIVQCADDKYARGAEHVIRILLRSDPSSPGPSRLALCLRLMNSAPVSAHLTDELMEAVFNPVGARLVSKDEASAISLFGLHRDPRLRLLSRIRGRSESSDPPDLAWNRAATADICSAWLQLSKLGEARRFESDWAESVEELLSRLRADPGEILDHVLSSWLISEGSLSLAGRAVSPEAVALLAFPVFGEKYTVGYGITALTRLVDGKPRPVDERLVSEICKCLLPHLPIHDEVMQVLDAYFRTWVESKGDFNSRHLDALTEPTLHFLVWLSLALYQYGGGKLHPLCRYVDTAGPGKLVSRLIVTYNAQSGRPPSRQVVSAIGGPISGKELVRLVPNPPTWLNKWCRGIRIGSISDSERAARRRKS